jgi:tetratricopeptide (TPR) repeat protein
MILRMPNAQKPTALRARVAYTLGTIHYRLGDYGSGRRLQEDEALTIFRQIGDRQGMAATLIGVALNKQALQQSDEAREHLQLSVQMWRELGNDSAADYALHNLGRIAAAQKDFATAWAILEPLAANFQARGDLRGAASAFCSLGDAAAIQGHFFKAKGYHQDGLELYRQVDDVAAIARVLADIGNVAREVGDFPGANDYYRESLRKAVEAARRTLIARALAGMGKCALAQGRFERALMLAGSGAELFQTIAASNVKKYRQTFSEILEQSRPAMDPAHYARILARSRCLALDQTLEYALAPD